MAGPRLGNVGREVFQEKPRRRVVIPVGNKGVTRKVLPSSKGTQHMTLDQRFTMIQQLRQASSNLSKSNRERLLQKKRGFNGPSQEKSAGKTVEPGQASGQKADKAKRRRGGKIRGTGVRPNSVKMVRKRKKKTGKKSPV